jgi:hypothetical protein
MSLGVTAMATRLTAIWIENLKPGPARREIPDGKGLYLILQPSGAKSWAVRYRFAGKPRKLTLGHLSLAAARAEAAKALLEVEQGRDPGEIKKAARGLATGQPRGRPFSGPSFFPARGAAA